MLAVFAGALYELPVTVVAALMTSSNWFPTWNFTPMELAVSSLAPGDALELRTKSRGSVLPLASEYTIGSLIHVVIMKLVMLPNASVASPRSAAEFAAPLAFADCVAFPVSPFVKHIALAPVAAPLTPEPARPPKSLAAPAPLYVLKLTLTP